MSLKEAGLTAVAVLHDLQWNGVRVKEGGAGQPAMCNTMIITGFETCITNLPGPGPGLGVPYRIGVGAWTSAQGVLPPASPSVQVMHTAYAQRLGYTKSFVSVGGVKGNFTTRSR